ncbi:MAG TPA: DNA oxidative demethylase AlkB [Terriglobales bacterium]|nr:DNA oxidative demethylase AlkB [Terriglobales bacterium]
MPSRRQVDSSYSLFPAEEPKLDAQGLSEGARLLKAFAIPDIPELKQALRGITKKAPFRNMVTPGGYRMSVAMTNCGQVGWITDRSGYRYEAIDPESGKPWPPMPHCFLDLAKRAATAAGFLSFLPDGCLINRYDPGTRLSLHQDRNEHDFRQPIVSVSLGLRAVFLWGGGKRSERPRRIRLESGDVVVWGGPARLNFHGVAPLAEGTDPVFGTCRINLTFRKAL